MNHLLSTIYLKWLTILCIHRAVFFLTRNKCAKMFVEIPIGGQSNWANTANITNKFVKFHEINKMPEFCCMTSLKCIVTQRKDSIAFKLHASFIIRNKESSVLNAKKRHIDCVEGNDSNTPINFLIYIMSATNCHTFAHAHSSRKQYNNNNNKCDWWI